MIKNKYKCYNKNKIFKIKEEKTKNTMFQVFLNCQCYLEVLPNDHNINF